MQYFLTMAVLIYKVDSWKIKTSFKKSRVQLNFQARYEELILQMCLIEIHSFAMLAEWTATSGGPQIYSRSKISFLLAISDIGYILKIE